MNVDWEVRQQLACALHALCMAPIMQPIHSAAACHASYMVYNPVIILPGTPGGAHCRRDLPPQGAGLLCLTATQGCKFWACSCASMADYLRSTKIVQTTFTRSTALHCE